MSTGSDIKGLTLDILPKNHIMAFEVKLTICLTQALLIGICDLGYHVIDTYMIIAFDVALVVQNLPVHGLGKHLWTREFTWFKAEPRMAPIEFMAVMEQSWMGTWRTTTENPSPRP
jgi:hypothetical protein